MRHVNKILSQQLYVLILFKTSGTVQARESSQVISRSKGLRTIVTRSPHITNEVWKSMLVFLLSLVWCKIPLNVLTMEKSKLAKRSSVTKYLKTLQHL